MASLGRCVEELLLNSLQAGCACVAVRVHADAGRVQVADNGAGLSRASLELAGMRYHSGSAQAGVGGGPRGEALASLAHLAALLLIESRARGQAHTWAKVFRNGRARPVSPALSGRPSPGTTVTLSGLFHRLPVRRRRLTRALEWERLRRGLEALALLHPRVSFTLRDEAGGGALVVRLPRTGGLQPRFAQLHGPAAAAFLVPVQQRGPAGLHLSGFIGRRGHSSKARQLVFVNGRLVLRTRLHRLLDTQLRGRLRPEAAGPKPRATTAIYPVYVLNIGCEEAAYDACWEPGRTLIEFLAWEPVLSCLEAAVQDFLQREGLLPAEAEQLPGPQGEAGPGEAYGNTALQSRPVYRTDIRAPEPVSPPVSAQRPPDPRPVSPPEPPECWSDSSAQDPVYCPSPEDHGQVLELCPINSQQDLNPTRGGQGSTGIESDLDSSFQAQCQSSGKLRGNRCFNAIGYEAEQALDLNRQNIGTKSQRLPRNIPELPGLHSHFPHFLPRTIETDKRKKIYLPKTQFSLRGSVTAQEGEGTVGPGNSAKRITASRVRYSVPSNRRSWANTASWNRCGLGKSFTKLFKPWEQVDLRVSRGSVTAPSTTTTYTQSRFHKKLSFSLMTGSLDAFRRNFGRQDSISEKQDPEGSTGIDDDIRVPVSLGHSINNGNAKDRSVCAAPGVPAHCSHSDSLQRFQSNARYLKRWISNDSIFGEKPNPITLEGYSRSRTLLSASKPHRTLAGKLSVMKGFKKGTDTNTDSAQCKQPQHLLPTCKPVSPETCPAGKVISGSCDLQGTLEKDQCPKMNNLAIGNAMTENQCAIIGSNFSNSCGGETIDIGAVPHLGCDPAPHLGCDPDPHLGCDPDPHLVCDPDLHQSSGDETAPHQSMEDAQIPPPSDCVIDGVNERHLSVSVRGSIRTTWTELLGIHVTKEAVETSLYVSPSDMFKDCALDWLQYFDVTLGKMVYVNTLTGLSSYEAPPECETQAACTKDFMTMAVNVVSRTGECTATEHMGSFQVLTIPMVISWICTGIHRDFSGACGTIYRF